MENIDLNLFNESYERYRSVFWLILNLSHSKEAIQDLNLFEICCNGLHDYFETIINYEFFNDLV